MDGSGLAKNNFCNCWVVFSFTVDLVLIHCIAKTISRNIGLYPMTFTSSEILLYFYLCVSGLSYYCYALNKFVGKVTEMDMDI